MSCRTSLCGSITSVTVLLWIRAKTSRECIAWDTLHVILPLTEYTTLGTNKVYPTQQLYKIQIRRPMTHLNTSVLCNVPQCSLVNFCQTTWFHISKHNALLLQFMQLWFKQLYFTCCYKWSHELKCAQILSLNGRPCGRSSAASVCATHTACCRWATYAMV
jgi:hypothetical protein